MARYAPRAPHFENNPLPFRPKPRPDELFSSWLCHITSGYGSKIQSFCHLMWPDTAIWNRDVDRSASEALLMSVARMTATPITAARQTLLRGLEGSLFRSYIPNGHTKWIMPLGLYHRTRRRPGLQFCPQCLDSPGSYWRRSWRLSLSTVCDMHNCALRDRCPHCSFPIHFHRRGMGDRNSTQLVPESICTKCRQSLSCPGDDPHPSRRAIGFQDSLLLRLENAPSSLEYFEVLAHLASLLATQRSRFEGFRERASRSSGHPLPEARLPGERITTLFDAMDLPRRRAILAMLDWLLDEWPERLVRCAQDTSVRASDLSRNFIAAPEWYLQAIEPLSDSRRHSHSSRRRAVS
jgi:hypothetical protein